MQIPFCSTAQGKGRATLRRGENLLVGMQVHCSVLKIVQNVLLDVLCETL